MHSFLLNSNFPIVLKCEIKVQSVHCHLKRGNSDQMNVILQYFFKWCSYKNITSSAGIRTLVSHRDSTHAHIRGVLTTVLPRLDLRISISTSLSWQKRWNLNHLFNLWILFRNIIFLRFLCHIYTFFILNIFVNWILFLNNHLC